MKDKKFLAILRESVKADLAYLEGRINWAEKCNMISMCSYYKGQREALKRLQEDIERHYELKEVIKVGGTD